MNVTRRLLAKVLEGLRQMHARYLKRDKNVQQRTASQQEEEIRLGPIPLQSDARTAAHGRASSTSMKMKMEPAKSGQEGPFPVSTFAPHYLVTSFPFGQAHITVWNSPQIELRCHVRVTCTCKKELTAGAGEHPLVCHDPWLPSQSPC